MVKVNENEFEISPDEIRQVLESEAQRRFQLGWSKARALYATGELDSGDMGDLLILADLLEESAAA